MKIEWLDTDVTADGSSDRADHAILGVILAGRFSCQFRPFFVIRGPLFGVGTPTLEP